VGQTFKENILDSSQSELREIKLISRKLH
jgi:hypothetical protein